MATTIPALKAEPSQPKRIRLNPARRKSAQAKVQSGRTAQLNSSTASNDDLNGRKRPLAPRIPSSPDQYCPHIPTKNQSIGQPDNEQKATATQSRFPPPAQSKSSALALSPAAIVTGGLIGCVAGAAILLSAGIWYDYAGVESALLAARSTRICLDNLTDEVIANLKSGTYSTDEALDMLRRTTLAYASTIPGGTPYVERIFREVSLVRKERGQEIDKILSESYRELSSAGRNGASPDQMRQLVIRRLAKLSTFASNSIRDVVDRNPDLKIYRDGTLKSLQGSRQPKIKLNMTVRQKKPVEI
ncbi:hypothetical protein M433DRAFT_150322 [Acidomyces richmondensis BFW]|nr:MAG: hypothetical protein FE78DRAFT_92923 [Acidomyces sp. 'richmondensis']KYG49157.1 hypothetical protein M433DRAFT_150322 [Acidomyces richmondensis BFW]